MTKVLHLLRPPKDNTNTTYAPFGRRFHPDCDDNKKYLASFRQELFSDFVTFCAAFKPIRDRGLKALVVARTTDAGHAKHALSVHVFNDKDKVVVGRNTWGAKEPTYQIDQENFVMGALHAECREHQPTSKVEDTVDDTDPGSLVQEKKTEYYESDDTCGQSDLDCQYVKYAKAAEKGLKDGTCADQGCPHETGTQTKTCPIIGDIVITTYDKAAMIVV